MIALTHEIMLAGYAAHTDEGPKLNLGNAQSYGIERLHLDMDAAWAGLTVTATFVPPGTLGTRVLVDAAGNVEVPPQATAAATTKGEIVFAGTADGVQLVSATLLYMVGKHVGIEGGAAPPTPSVYEQWVAEVKDDAERAEQAAGEAETDADRADAATVHAPVIHGGTWWVWSQDAGDYIDTGQPAQGPEAELTLADNFDIDKILNT